MEDKRQLCIFKLASEKQEPWLWWQYAAGYSERCTMANGKFGDAACADAETRTVGLDLAAVATCMGDSDADAEHPLLQVLPRGQITCVQVPSSCTHQLHTKWQLLCRCTDSFHMELGHMHVPSFAVHVHQFEAVARAGSTSHQVCIRPGDVCTV